MRSVRNLCLAILVIAAVACKSNDDRLGDWSKSSAFDGKPRSGAVSFKLGDKIYVGLGYNEDNKDSRELRDFWTFNGTTWAQVADSFPGAARSSAVAFVLDGKAYVGTGYASHGSASDTLDPERFSDFYSFDGTRWSRAGDVAPMPGNPRRNAVAFALKGLGYVGTGSEDASTRTKDFYSYNPGTNSWTIVEAPISKREGAAAFVIGEGAYVCLGANGSCVNDMWKFTPGNSPEWEKLESLVNKDGRSWDDDYGQIPRVYAVSFVLGDAGNQRAYVATGMNGGRLNSVFEYNPYRDRWDEVTTLSPYMTTRVQAVGFSIGARGFVSLGGTAVDGGGVMLDDTWSFAPGIKENDKNDYD